MKTLIILFLISSTFSIRKEMSKKIQKAKKSTTKDTYSNTVTVDSVTFTDNCFAFEKGYTFILDISQTSNNYPISLTNEIYLQSVDNTEDDIPCTCTASAGSNTLECVLDKDPSTTKLNNKEFKVKAVESDNTFSCYATGSTKKETCLLKAFDYDDSITYHNLYDILSSEQNHTYSIDYTVKNEGDIYVKFDTFVMGEGPTVTLDGTEIKYCDEIAYSDNEDEGEYIVCTIKQSQFPVADYETYTVIVENQCGYEEYPGIKVAILNTHTSSSNILKFGLSLLFVFMLF